MNKGKVFATCHEDFKLDWCTPDDVYQPLHSIFDFTTDLMADASSTKCAWYIDDILNMDPCTIKLDEVCWINPRYGRWLYEVMPVIENIGRTNTVVALLPASLDLSWFHNYIVHHDDVRVFCRRGRIQFIPTAKIRAYYRKRELQTGKKWSNSPANANILVVYGAIGGAELTALAQIGWRQI